MSLILFFNCGCLMINVFLLSKFFLSHESRSIAILDHFQSWKSLQRTGWKKEGNKSSFIHSLPPLRSARQARRLITISIIASFLSLCVQFCIFLKKNTVPFYVSYIECNVWWILPFNECSQCRSQFTNPNTFQRLNATVAGTEKCFQYRNCVNNNFN